MKEGVPAYPRSVAADRRAAGGTAARRVVRSRPATCGRVALFVGSRCLRPSTLAGSPQGKPLARQPAVHRLLLVAPATDIEGSGRPANIRVALVLPIMTTKEAQQAIHETARSRRVILSLLSDREDRQRN